MPRVAFDPAIDYYKILGVEPGAPVEAIQAAYRKLAKAFHPDLNAGSSVAAERMARLNVAKAVLLDPQTRDVYDQARASRLSRPLINSTNTYPRSRARPAPAHVPVREEPVAAAAQSQTQTVDGFTVRY